MPTRRIDRTWAHDIALASFLTVVFVVANHVWIVSPRSPQDSALNLHARRYSAYRAAGMLSGKVWPDEFVTEAVNQRDTLLVGSRRIVLLLSNVGCHPCQVRELRSLSLLRRRYADKASFSVVYVDSTQGDNRAREDLLILKKLANAADLEAYYNVSGDRLFRLVKGAPFPLYAFVIDGRVVLPFAPLPEDELYSSEFFDFATRLLEEDDS